MGCLYHCHLSVAFLLLFVASVFCLQGLSTFIIGAVPRIHKPLCEYTAKISKVRLTKYLLFIAMKLNILAALPT
jgi:hypothetical protein